MTDSFDEDRAEMSSADQNDLPDSAFAYIEPGGKKDDEGKTVPRSLRHFPIHDAAHVRNALARAPQSPFGPKAMPKILAAAKKFGIEVSDDTKSDDEPAEERADCPTCKGTGKIMAGNRKCPDCNGTGETKSISLQIDGNTFATVILPSLQVGIDSATEAKSRKPRHSRDLALQTKCRRQYDGAIEMRTGVKDASTGADLVELTGQVIGYDTPYQVADAVGSFTETIHHGACRDALASPDLDVCFLVGHDASLVPLARTGAKASLDLTETLGGLQVRALIDPRMAGAQELLLGIENGTINRMSVGMQVDPDGDDWSGEDAHGFPNVRHIHKLANIFDASAVAMPANPNTALELASARMEEFPPEVNARVQHLEHLAKEGRKGTLTAADSDALLTVVRRIFRPSTDRSAPTKQDPGILKAIVAVHQATGAALAAQSEDSDNNSDPVDKKVLGHLQDAHNAATAALAAQAKDGTPDGSASSPAGDDGTQNAGYPVGGSNAGDGTGSRGDETPAENRNDALRLELDLLKLRRRAA